MAVAPQTFFKHQQPTREQVRAKATRAEAAVLKAVRAEVFARDGECRFALETPTHLRGDYGMCQGPLTLAHLPPYRRSQTRGLSAAQRHFAAGCVVLCARHHEAEERHEIKAKYKHFAEMANGPMAWTVAAPKTLRRPA